MLKQKYTVEVEGMPLSFSTGTLAQRANGSVMVQSGDTVVFVSATMAKEVAPDQDFFPLTVDYREKFSAAGRFPGGYIKREGKPTEKEILTSRLCDRPLRPLFPSDFLNEVQKKVPAINSNGYYSINEEKFVSVEYAKDEEKSILDQYHTIEYSFIAENNNM